jgi:hypothetical protein
MTLGEEKSVKIEFRRVHTPEEMVKEPCAICEVHFQVESVVAVPVGGDGAVCLPCLRYLGQRNRGKFPSVGAYEEARKRYPEPLFSGVEEIRHLEREEMPAASEALRASWIAH